MALDHTALREAFTRWQYDGRIHPWTCREDGCRALLDMEFVGESVTLRCHECGYVQYLYDTSINLIASYTAQKWACLGCDGALADGEAVLCAKCHPHPRCERCGNYESICGHNLPFAERIKSVNVDRSSLK